MNGPSCYQGSAVCSVHYCCFVAAVYYSVNVFVVVALLAPSMRACPFATIRVCVGGEACVCLCQHQGVVEIRESIFNL